MPEPPLLSILVVSYNTREMTLTCLRSVLRETRRCSFELVVVDNASSDGSATAIAAEFPDQLTLIASQENLGFARANNLAAQHAVGRYLLLLNPDTVVFDGAIDRLVDFARARPAAGIWGGRTQFADGRLNPGSCWGRPTLWSLACQASGLTSLCRGTSLFNPEGVGGWDRCGERDVDIVSGCFLLIERGLWERLGGFDAAFFMYGEDADLCLRARALGVRPRVHGGIAIVHHGGASERVRADKLVRLLTAKQQLIMRHLPPWQRRLASWLLFGWPLSRWLVHALRRPGCAVPGAAWREAWRRRREYAAGPSA